MAGEFRGTAGPAWSHQRAVKGPRFRVNVRAYYYEFRDNGTRAWKLRLACYSFPSFSSSLSLFRAWRSGEIKQASFATKRPVGRKKKPDWAFLPCRDILYLDAYSTKGKNRLLLARSLRRLISTLSGRGKIYGGCLVSFLFRFDRKRERERRLKILEDGFTSL